MAKKVIKINESQLRGFVKDTVKSVLDENATLSLNYYDEPEQLVEMVRINMKESGKGSIFPFNAWEVKIWSDDHEPPHFHDNHRKDTHGFSRREELRLILFSLLNIFLQRNKYLYSEHV